MDLSQIWPVYIPIYAWCLAFSECLYAEILKRVLESDWNLLLEDIGIWIPAEVVNKEIDDKPENEEELGIRKSFLTSTYFYYTFLFETCNSEMNNI